MPTFRRLRHIGLLCLCAVAIHAAGSESRAADSPASAGEICSIVSIGQIAKEPDWSYIITHGMGGTTDGDRFERLGKAIKLACPHSNVYLVDWTAAAKGSPWPWVVARSIGRVAFGAYEELTRLGVDPQRLTMIGESFGNHVNLRVAAKFGQVARMLALNPANELGGGGPLDLTKHSGTSWAFHSQSPFDTHRQVAHRGILLHAAADSSAREQHSYGAKWLRQTLAGGERDWLDLERYIPAAPQGMFDVAILADGGVDWELAPRRGYSLADVETIAPDEHVEGGNTE